MFRRSFLFVLAFLCLVGLGFSLTVINSLPYTANVTGETYILNTNLSSTGHGITITANNINLNCQGYNITGDDGASDYGIYVPGVWDGIISGTDVSNCVIRDFGVGLYFNYGDSGSLINITSYSNTGDGIYMYYSDGNTLENIYTHNNGGDGTDIYICTTMTITNITSTDNTVRGIRLRNPNTLSIYDANASNNGDAGIQNDNSWGPYPIQNVVANGNGGSGIGNINGQVYNAIANNNGGYGIYGNTITVTNATCIGNAHGLYTRSTSVITDVRLINNTGYGLYGASGSGMTFQNSIVTGNNYGIYFSSLDSATIRHNYIKDNTIDVSLNSLSNLNTLYNNSLVSNAFIIDSPASSLNKWNNTVTGNWWEAYDSDFEGCVDGDVDGFCDSSYSIDSNSIDYMPIYTGIPQVVYNCTSCSECNSLIYNNATTNDKVQLINNITNHAGTCIVINVSSVYFDCAGNTIDGTGTGTGIFVDDAEGKGDANVIQNCFVTGFSDGIYLDTVNLNDILNVETYNNVDDGIDFYYGDNTIMTNVTSYLNGDYGIYFSYSDGNALTNIFTHSNGNDGISLISSATNVITNIASCNNTGDGISYNTDTTGSITIGNFSDNTGNGILTTSWGPPFYNIVANNNGGHGLNGYSSIYNSILNGNGGNCYYVGSSRVIDNVTCNYNANGLYIDTAYTVSNVRIINNTGYGIYVYYGASNTISNSIITGNSGTGIIFSNGDTNNVYNNVIKNNGFDFSMDANSAGNDIYNNSFNSKTYITDSGTGNNWNNTVIGNWWEGYDSEHEGCSDGNLDGFCDASYSKGNMVDYMPVYTGTPQNILNCTSCSECNSLIAINVSPNDMVRLINDITDNAGTCITIAKNDVYFDCDDNTIDGTGTGSGIYVDGNLGLGANNHISNCVITGFSDGLFLDYADSNTLSDITTYSNADDGVYMYYSDSNVLSSITSYSNTGDGIYMYFSKYGILSDITTYSNTGHGMQIISPDTSTTYYNVNSSYNTGYGIYSDNGLSGTFNTIFINNNGAYGFLTDGATINTGVLNNNGAGYCFGSSSTSVLNDVTCNYNANGVYIRSLATLDNVEIVNNTGIGIYVNFGSSNVIRHSTITGNGGNGLYLNSGDSNTIFNNTIKDNNVDINLLSTSNTNTIYGNKLLTASSISDGANNNNWDNGTIGNFWTDLTCIASVERGPYTVCTSPASYTVNAGMGAYDDEPLVYPFYYSGSTPKNNSRRGGNISFSVYSETGFLWANISIAGVNYTMIDVGNNIFRYPYTDLPDEITNITFKVYTNFGTLEQRTFIYYPINYSIMPFINLFGALFAVLIIFLSFNLNLKPQTRKALTGIIASSLLLLAAIVMFVSFQAWYSNFTDSFHIKQTQNLEVINSKNTDFVKFTSAGGLYTLHVKNYLDSYIIVDNVKVNGVFCDLTHHNVMLAKNLNEIELDCASVQSSNEIAVFSRGGIYDFNLPLS